MSERNPSKRKLSSDSEEPVDEPEVETLPSAASSSSIREDEQAGPWSITWNQDSSSDSAPSHSTTGPAKPIDILQMAIQDIFDTSATASSYSSEDAAQPQLDQAAAHSIQYPQLRVRPDTLELIHTNLPLVPNPYQAEMAASYCTPKEDKQQSYASLIGSRSESPQSRTRRLVSPFRDAPYGRRRSSSTPRHKKKSNRKLSFDPYNFRLCAYYSDNPAEVFQIRQLGGTTRSNVDITQNELSEITQSGPSRTHLGYYCLTPDSEYRLSSSSGESNTPTDHYPRRPLVGHSRTLPQRPQTSSEYDELRGQIPQAGPSGRSEAVMMPTEFSDSTRSESSPPRPTSIQSMSQGYGQDLRSPHYSPVPLTCTRGRPYVYFPKPFYKTEAREAASEDHQQIPEREQFNESQTEEFTHTISLDEPWFALYRDENIPTMLSSQELGMHSANQDMRDNIQGISVAEGLHAPHQLIGEALEDHSLQGSTMTHRETVSAQMPNLLIGQIPVNFQFPTVLLQQPQMNEQYLPSFQGQTYPFPTGTSASECLPPANPTTQQLEPRFLYPQEVTQQFISTENMTLRTGGETGESTQSSSIPSQYSSTQRRLIARRSDSDLLINRMEDYIEKYRRRTMSESDSQMGRPTAPGGQSSTQTVSVPPTEDPNRPSVPPPKPARKCKKPASAAPMAQQIYRSKKPSPTKHKTALAEKWLQAEKDIEARRAGSGQTGDAAAGDQHSSQVPHQRSHDAAVADIVDDAIVAVEKAHVTTPPEEDENDT